MSKKEKHSPNLHAKRDSSGSGDRRRSAASGDGETGGERRVSRESGGSAEILPASQGTGMKKVLFSEPATAKDSVKRLSQTGPPLEHQTSQGEGEEDSPKSQKKIVSTWRMACGMTKDKTKDLLKRWRTLPDQGNERPPLQELKANTGDHGWSVHVWGFSVYARVSCTMSSLREIARMSPTTCVKGDFSKDLGIFLLEQDTTAFWRLIFVPVRQSTWVKRCPSDDEPCDSEKEKGKSWAITPSQKEKLSYFFAHVFDMDRDDVIALQDFEGFTERLRHFAEWSSNSGEYLTLQQVQQGLIETFIYPLKQDGESCEGNDNGERTPKDLDRLFLSLEDWLNFWGEILDKKKSFYDLPLWLQYFPKVLFKAINKSGSGCLSKEELGAFYSSVMSYPPQKLVDLLDEAYNAMTAGGDFKLTYDCYRLCFANFLFGRYPNGPGQFVFGAAQKSPPALFPIDYTAMNTPPEDIEPYNGSLRSNRRSVIV